MVQGWMVPWMVPGRALGHLRHTNARPGTTRGATRVFHQRHIGRVLRSSGNAARCPLAERGRRVCVSGLHACTIDPERTLITRSVTCQ